MSEAIQKEELNERENSSRSKLQREKPVVYEKVIKYKEKVARGESVALIVLNYDYLCNFECEHCCADNFMLKTRKEREADTRKYLTPESVKDLCDQADAMGLANLVISGGEVLVYKDLDRVVEAIGPQRFSISIDTNAWHLDENKARHLKSIGIDKVQISLDSLDPEEHDRFRKKPGSHARIMKAIDASRNAGLNVLLLTCVWKQRAKSQELIDFLEFAKSKGLPSYITLAKPVGSWEGHFDAICGDEEINYIKELEKKYDVTTRMSASHGIDLGCIAVKRSITVTKYGDVMPCPYQFVSLGNIFNESLKDIIERGLRIKHYSYGEKRTCISGNIDHSFIKNYMTKMYGVKGTVPYDKVFTADDFLDGKMR